MSAVVPPDDGLREQVETSLYVRWGHLAVAGGIAASLLLIVLVRSPWALAGIVPVVLVASLGYWLAGDSEVGVLEGPVDWLAGRR